MRGVHLFPHAERHVSAWAVALVLFLALAVVVAVPGCTVPPKAADQIRVDTAAADGVVRQWDQATDRERRIAYLDLREGMWLVRYLLLDELPEHDTVLRLRILTWLVRQ